MQNLNFRQLVAQHPEILIDRHKLSFSPKNSPEEAASQLSQSGVVMLRDVLPGATLKECRETFRRFVGTLGKKGGDADLREGDNTFALDDGPNSEWDNGEVASGSWHPPWVVQYLGRSPTSVVLTELIKSWAWPVIEKICDSQDIVVMFGMCIARHRIDEELTIGVHQDAKAVCPEIPLALWIPLSETAPNRHSGLGFVVPNPGKVLLAGSDNDLGSDYVLDNLDRVWVPHYHPGDLTIHSRFSPHFTTGYGTQSDRYSLEIRLWANQDSLMRYYDPSVRIARRNGVPVVVETKCSLGMGAHGFLANTAHLAMQAVSPAGKLRRTPLTRRFMGAFRAVVR
jgi:hypothetical protein